ncbi:MAG: thioredoxin fold domain-containing protein [Candidatus Eisenbacteria bacterium]
MRRWHRSLVGLLGLCLAACGGDGSSKDGQSAPADANRQSSVETEDHAAEGGVVWTDLSFDEVLKKAADEHKLILVDVWSPSCHQCEVMNDEVWNTPDGVHLVGDAIPIKIHSDAQESYSFRYRYPITGLPAVLLLDSDGTEINRVVGYSSKRAWLPEASAMMTGVDPIPDLETQVAENPDDLPLRVTLLDRYLERAREEDAHRLMEEVVAKDRSSAHGQAEKAVRSMARYYAFFRMDASGADGYYRTIVEQFPQASGLTGALKSTLDQARATGQVAAWTEWVCGLARKRESDGHYNSTIAMFAYRNKLTAPCLAEAARRAARSGDGAAGIDTVAVHLEGK